MMKETLPVLSTIDEDPDWNRHVVMITHDETTFYANGGLSTLWMEAGTDKSVGSSIMVSGFVCECHGFMIDELGKSYQLFYGGKNRDGWFTNDYLVHQLQTVVIPLPKRLHSFQ